MQCPKGPVGVLPSKRKFCCVVTILYHTKLQTNES
uniref:Uncharacterized protein n=1 Tax=Anguilla anguilla TaxID=7936 RepID=A0A0E9WEA8_ANGAN